jgi:hypothetical protein
LTCSTVDLDQCVYRHPVVLSIGHRWYEDTAFPDPEPQGLGASSKGTRGNPICLRTTGKRPEPRGFVRFYRPGDESGAMQRACIGSPTERPAATTYRDSRPGLGKGTGTRYVRQRVTGSARHRGNCPSLALGPYSTDAGWRVETVNIPMSPCRRLDERKGRNHD